MNRSLQPALATKSLLASWCNLRGANASFGLFKMRFQPVAPFLSCISFGAISFAHRSMLVLYFFEASAIVVGIKLSACLRLLSLSTELQRVPRGRQY